MSVQAGDVIRVTAKAVLDGTEDVQQVYHAKNVGIGELSDAATHSILANRIDGSVGEYNTHVTDDLAYTTIESFNVTQDAPMVEDEWNSHTHGDSALELLPSQVALLCLFPTATARSLGKKYLGIFTEGANDVDGTPSAALVADAADYGAALMGVMVQGEADFLWGNYRILGALFSPWLSVTVSAIWATQRRRRLGVGS